MKGNRAIKIAVDIAMSTVLVATMSTALVQEVPHEWLGIALFVLMIAHAVLNRKWILGILRSRRNESSSSSVPVFSAENFSSSTSSNSLTEDATADVTSPFPCRYSSKIDA